MLFHILLQNLTTYYIHIYVYRHTHVRNVQQNFGVDLALSLSSVVQLLGLFSSLHASAQKYPEKRKQLLISSFYNANPNNEHTTRWYTI